MSGVTEIRRTLSLFSRHDERVESYTGRDDTGERIYVITCHEMQSLSPIVIPVHECGYYGAQC